MKVQEIMERVGMTETGRAIAYIKDGLEEMNVISSENIVNGKVSSITSNLISFGNGSETLTNNDLGGASGTTKPTSWTVYEDDVNETEPDFANMEFESLIENPNTRTSGRWLEMTSKEDLSDSTPTGNQKYQGIYQEITVVDGVSYNLTATLDSGDYDSSFQLITVAVHNAEFAGAPGSYYGSVGTNGAVDDENTVSISFVAEGTRAWVGIFTTSLFTMSQDTTDLSFYVGDLTLQPNNSIKHSNGGFRDFDIGMKLSINGSKLNDTDNSDNTSTGYYIIGGVKSDGSEILVEGGVPFIESAGNTITARGQTNNYIDIIENKRYYDLPSDMIKLLNVKIKNHLNTKDEYRSIPRMIGEPTITDSDNI